MHYNLRSRSYEACIEIASRRGEADCIIWPLSIEMRVRHMGYTSKAHDVVCSMAHGDRPEWTTLHKCRRDRMCVNPDHMYWGSVGMSFEDILCIRLLYGIYPGAVIAHALGISATTVYRIASRKVHASVPSPARRFNLEHWRNVVRMEDAACRS